MAGVVVMHTCLQDLKARIFSTYIDDVVALRSPACNQNRMLQNKMTCQYADKAQATSMSYGFSFCHEFEDVWSSLFEQVRKVFRATVPYAANSKNFFALSLVRFQPYHHPQVLQRGNKSFAF